jgi:hypothetical protein
LPGEQYEKFKPDQGCDDKQAGKGGVGASLTQDISER